MRSVAAPLVLIVTLVVACSGAEIASTTGALEVDPSSTTSPAAPEAFLPPTRSAQGVRHLPLTLLDGSHLTLAYPSDLDLTSLGVQMQTLGSLEGSHSRVIGAHYGSPESFVSMSESGLGPAELAATFPGAEGGTVERWEFPEGGLAYLVYDFDTWTVSVADEIGRGLDDEAQALWSASLRGEIYHPGFLVLEADLPLELTKASDDLGPDGPDIRVDGTSGSLLVSVNDCDRMTRFDDERYGQEVFAFCDEPTNTLLLVAADHGVQERIHRELVVNPPPPGASLNVLPLLDKPTDSRVYFSTDQHLTVVEVDARTVVSHQMPELAPGDPPYRLVRRGDRLVFYGKTSVGPALYGLDPSMALSPTLIADDAWFFVPAAAEDRVWIAVLDLSSPDTVRGLESLREITVDGAVTTRDVPPPDGRWPVAALTEGLVFQNEQDLGIWDPDGQAFVATLPGVFPVASMGNRMISCAIACGELNLIDLESETQRVVDLPLGVVSINGYGGAFSPNGRYAAAVGLVTYGPITRDTRAVIVLVDFEEGTASVVPGAISANPFGYPQVAWNVEGDWLFMGPANAHENSADLLAFQPGDSTAYRVPVVIDTVYHGMAAD